MGRYSFYKAPINRWIYFYNPENDAKGLLYKVAPMKATGIFISRVNQKDLVTEVIMTPADQPDYTNKYTKLVSNKDLGKYKLELIKTIIEFETKIRFEPFSDVRI